MVNVVLPLNVMLLLPDTTSLVVTIETALESDWLARRDWSTLLAFKVNVPPAMPPLVELLSNSVAAKIETLPELVLVPDMVRVPALTVVSPE